MTNSGERVTDVGCTEDKLTVNKTDGRSISMPLAWCLCLLHATLGSVTTRKLLALALARY